MADPISLTLAIVGTTVAVAGTAIGTVSAVQSQRAQAQLASHNAALDERNAQFAAQQAKYNEARSRERARKLRGKQIVSGAASGLGLAGSLFDALNESAVQSELEALTIRRQGQFQTDSFLSSADANRARAANINQQASTTLTAGLLQAGGQAVSGFGSIAGAFSTPATAATSASSSATALAGNGSTTGLTQQFLSNNGAAGTDLTLGVF